MPRAEGLRERKRRETRQRIVEEGLRLFLARGFDATTLDDIARAADISRRTFFSYFTSKEDIVMAWQSGHGAIVHAAILEASPDQAPLDAVLQTLLTVVSHFTPTQMLEIDRLMRSTESLRARKQAGYIQRELELFDALTARWPQPARRASLRIVAMVSVGALRLALEAWNEDGGTRPVSVYLRRAFANVKAAVRD